MKIKILATGLTGLVGSRFTELFEEVYEFEHISLSHGIDILDQECGFRKNFIFDGEVSYPHGSQNTC